MSEMWKSERLRTAEAQLDKALAGLAAAEAKVAEAATAEEIFATPDRPTGGDGDDDQAGFTVLRDDAW
ncbi:MAG TPA: hypothetical protein VM677_12600 [Actinokineospora sp.]|nr:hypothetical protein [Actinokineospora sp.]